MRQKAFVVLLVTMVAGMTLAAYLSTAARHKTKVPAELTGIVWPVPRDLDGFMLSDHFGREFGHSELEGQWTMMFFGYTSCPDVCPSTLADLRKAVRELGNDPVADPQRDVFVDADIFAT